MGDKSAKYWDYNECRWAKCPASDGARSTTAEDVVVPSQQDAEADEQTVVVSPI